MRGASLRQCTILMIVMALGLGLAGHTAWAGTSRFDGAAVDSLNDLDQRNEGMLDEVIEASNEAAEGDSNVTFDEGNVNDESGKSEKTDYVKASGPKLADVSGTGGVALIEEEKDSLQTMASNISSVTSHMAEQKKVAERKVGGA